MASAPLVRQLSVNNLLENPYSFSPSSSGPRYNEIVLLQPNVSFCKIKERLYIVAAIASGIAYIALAASAFILAFLYAAPLIPAVMMLFTIMFPQGIRACSHFNNLAKEQQKKGEEDSFVERRLNEWKELTFSQVFEDIEPPFTNRFIGDETSSDCLKPLLARYLYALREEELSGKKLTALTNGLSDAKNALSSIEDKIFQESTHGKRPDPEEISRIEEDLKDCRSFYSKLETEKQKHLLFHTENRLKAARALLYLNRPSYSFPYNQAWHASSMFSDRPFLLPYSYLPSYEEMLEEMSIPDLADLLDDQMAATLTTKTDSDAI